MLRTPKGVFSETGRKSKGYSEYRKQVKSRFFREALDHNPLPVSSQALHDIGQIFFYVVEESHSEKQQQAYNGNGYTQPIPVNQPIG